MSIQPVSPESSAECIRLDDRRKPQRPSPYFSSGAPTQCARCAAPFQLNGGLRSCWHGADKGYYCSEVCSATARSDKHAA
jgi:hypothetical protein